MNGKAPKRTGDIIARSSEINTADPALVTLSISSWYLHCQVSSALTQEQLCIGASFLLRSPTNPSGGSCSERREQAIYNECVDLAWIDIRVPGVQTETRVLSDIQQTLCSLTLASFFPKQRNCCGSRNSACPFSRTTTCLADISVYTLTCTSSLGALIAENLSGVH